jgi:hypothetical protein
VLYLSESLFLSTSLLPRNAIAASQGRASCCSRPATIRHRHEISSLLRVLHGPEACGTECHSGQRRAIEKREFHLYRHKPRRDHEVSSRLCVGYRPQRKFAARSVYQPSQRQVRCGRDRHLSSRQSTTKVVYLANGNSSNPPSGAARIRGNTVSVTVPAIFLPSTDLQVSQCRFNYWPEEGGPAVSASVASFAPEFMTAQVGIMGWSLRRPGG